jgi:hypothetical protein
VWRQYQTNISTPSMMKLSFFDEDRVKSDRLNDGFLSNPGEP